MGDGYWTDRCDDKDVRGSVTRIGPVFQRDVTYADGDGWTCALNGEAMGGYPTLAGAKARIDWEVWNRLRQSRADDGLLARSLTGRTVATNIVRRNILPPRPW